MKRDVKFDLMRLIACFLVIVIHCCYPVTAGARVFRAVAVVSVPLFVMLSGRYMLLRRPTPAQCIGRAARLFAVMLCWSALYYLLELFVLHTRQYEGLWAVVRYLLTQPNHLWYLYAAMALYLITPMLGCFAEQATPAEYRYALAFVFATGSVLFVLLRSGEAPLLGEIAERMKLNYMTGFIGCYLWGDYLRRYPLKRKGLLYAVGAVSAAATVGAALLWKEQYNGLVFSFFSPTVLAAAAAVYGAFSLERPRSSRWGAQISLWACCTGGVYLLHPSMVLCLQVLLKDTATPFYAIPLRAAAIFLLSMGAVFLLRKLPVIRKIF